MEMLLHKGLVLGFVIAFLSAPVVIKAFLKYVSRRGFAGFTY